MDGVVVAPSCRGGVHPAGQIVIGCCRASDLGILCGWRSCAPVEHVALRNVGSTDGLTRPTGASRAVRVTMPTLRPNRTDRPSGH